MIRRYLDMAPLMLGCFVLTGLVLGWFLPATYNLVFSLAMGQIVLAIIVVIREAQRLFPRR